MAGLFLYSVNVYEQKVTARSVSSARIHFLISNRNWKDGKNNVVVLGTQWVMAKKQNRWLKSKMQNAVVRY